MKIPVITGTGERLVLDSDDIPRAVLAEACDEIDPMLWEWFAQGSEWFAAEVRATPEAS